jgi:hypothetical protein
MNSDIWLPLVTLVGGWGLAQVTETLRDRRTTDRERLARRAELQRTTLLTLQDHLLEVLKLSAIWDALDADERTRLRHATAEGRLLASRVEHEDARKAANDGSVRSKGTMYFVMHPHGIHATGRWVGLSYDGNIVTGWSSMARSEEEARELVGKLKEQDASGSR